MINLFETPSLYKPRKKHRFLTYKNGLIVSYLFVYLLFSSLILAFIFLVMAFFDKSALFLLHISTLSLYVGVAIYYGVIFSLLYLYHWNKNKLVFTASEMSHIGAFKTIGEKINVSDGNGFSIPVKITKITKRKNGTYIIRYR
ncbi:hypothetical protein [Aquimarina algiphila]|uniref:Uncharacterized protein n=1 Tax=Aquimarina algiphila TaxID=2047982 RepID=A0A554VRQ8_9FLAO|nr:hypothetical protein [Aquimarina algiphila]TSE11308.1 hypothetical protein FOF46_01370 [Aquimarina algiphila]